MREKMSLDIAVIQMAVEPGTPAINMEKAVAMVREAAKNGSELIVLPELWYSGYALDQLAADAMPLSSHPGIQQMQRLAKEYGVFLAAGSVATKKQGSYYNTAVFIDNAGRITGQYDKIHLFPLGLHEDQYFAPGKDFCLVDTPWGRVGMILCYDIRFPALCQNLVLRGAEMLIIPAQFGAARIQHWNILAQARAIENQCFVLACDVTGDKDSGYCGSSLVVSPWGEVLVHGDDQETILYGKLDFSQIEKVRRTIPVFEQRRPIFDEIIDKK